MFEFRLITSKDFPQMFEWLSKEHIKKWWDDNEDTLEKVELHYGEKSDDVERSLLIEMNNGYEKPIGYFQYYFASNDEIGIDQFIGDENYLNKGVGEKTIKMFIELVKRAIRCYEKVGFKHYENRKTENGNSAYMMRFEI